MLSYSYRRQVITGLDGSTPVRLERRPVVEESISVHVNGRPAGFCYQPASLDLWPSDVKPSDIVTIGYRFIPTGTDPPPIEFNHAGLRALVDRDPNWKPSLP